MEYCVNKNLDETHRGISEHDIETKWDATERVIENYQMVMMMKRKKTSDEKKVKYTVLLLKNKHKFIGMPWIG